jgi:hypothetical protein
LSRAQQLARGLSGGCTAGPRELVVRRFLEFTNEYPWAWTAAHLDEWSVHLTAEKHRRQPSPLADVSNGATATRFCQSQVAS